ncbi:MAG TPA: hypothetical protein VIJ34_02680 [Acidimicrobiales bacterium]
MPLFSSRRTHATSEDMPEARLRKAEAASQARLDAMHARVEIESKLRDIGQLIYGERTGRSEGGDAEVIDRLVEEIRALEFPS